MQQSLLAGGALVSSATGLAASANSKIGEDAKPFKCNYGFHNGMFKNHAGPDFIDQIKFGHSMGFRSIEDNGMMSRKPEEQSKIGETLSKLGRDRGVFVI